MQHIPHHNLDEIERSRREMQAFRQELDNEEHVWPDLTLTGEDIHNAFCAVAPEYRYWAEVPEVARQLYNKVAAELNRELDGRQAWFEGEDKAISAIKCPSCEAMIENLRNHPCLEGK